MRVLRERAGIAFHKWWTILSWQHRENVFTSRVASLSVSALGQFALEHENMVKDREKREERVQVQLVFAFDAQVLKEMRCGDRMRNAAERLWS